jgi:hypothetical protein
VCLSGNLVFKGHDREQHWRPPWLLLELTMAGRKGAKTASERAELSKAGGSGGATTADATNANAGQLWPPW